MGFICQEYWDKINSSSNIKTNTKEIPWHFSSVDPSSSHGVGRWLFCGLIFQHQEAWCRSTPKLLFTWSFYLPLISIVLGETHDSEATSPFMLMRCHWLPQGLNILRHPVNDQQGSSVLCGASFLMEVDWSWTPCIAHEKNRRTCKATHTSWRWKNEVYSEPASMHFTQVHLLQACPHCKSAGVASCFWIERVDLFR